MLKFPLLWYRPGRRPEWRTKSGRTQGMAMTFFGEDLGDVNHHEYPKNHWDVDIC